MGNNVRVVANSVVMTDVARQPHRGRRAGPDPLAQPRLARLAAAVAASLIPGRNGDAAEFISMLPLL